ncbi:MAG: hypothetical protein IJT65_08435 [Eubacterium sp.]|nr:hypothetical protein [Eubacterium sp.]
MIENCKRCLLAEAGNKVELWDIEQFVLTLDKELLVSEEEYQKRITLCKECDELISGLCGRCGCYVELRARLKEKDCPNYDNRRW